MRAGRNGKQFTIFKFRTLYLEHFGIVPGEEEPEAYRITRLGKYLRRSKLDEIPQLFNVVLGQMSVVGPRPDILEQAANYSTFQRQRLSVKPGLTGITQVSGNTMLSWPDRIRLDLFYIENWSWLLDIRIISYTLFAIVVGSTLKFDPFNLHSQLSGKSHIHSDP